MKRVLGIICLVLAGALAWQWRAWPPPHGDLPPPNGPEEPDEPRASPPIETRLTLEPPNIKEDYASVIDRPLFLSSRRQPEEGLPAESAAPEMPATPETPLENFDLNAVIITPAGAFAWITTPTEPEPHKVQIGDELEGWKVKNILNDKLEMEGKGGSDSLVLRSFGSSGQPASKLPPRSERRKRPTPPPNRAPASSKPRDQKSSPTPGK